MEGRHRSEVRFARNQKAMTAVICLAEVWTRSAPCSNSFQALGRSGHDRQVYHFVKRPMTAWYDPRLAQCLFGFV